MERELWAWLMIAVRDVSRSHRDTAYHTHATALIVRVYLWAVLHDRPVVWACDPRHWDRATRPEDLPSQPTLSRRLRQPTTASFLNALGRRLTGHIQPALRLIKLLDGKPLSVAAHSKDPDATWGRGAGQAAKGYKLHLIQSGLPMPDVFAVTPLNISEQAVARTLLPRITGTGYVLADAGYDDSSLYRLASQRGHRFLAPRRKPHTGLAKKRHHPDRLRAIEQLEVAPQVGNYFGTQLMRLRSRIETMLGHLASFFAGLHHLPPWVRTLHRVRLYVHAKLLINAARIRTILE